MGRTEPGDDTLLKQVSGRISLFRKLILEATNCNLRGMKAHVSSSPGSVLPIGYKLVKSLRYKNTSLADDGKDGTR
jgi:hypothetical protein